MDTKLFYHLLFSWTEVFFFEIHEKVDKLMHFSFDNMTRMQNWIITRPNSFFHALGRLDFKGLTNPFNNKLPIFYTIHLSINEIGILLHFLFNYFLYLWNHVHKFAQISINYCKYVWDLKILKNFCHEWFVFLLFSYFLFYLLYINI